ncbi:MULTISPECIES: cytochrome C [unclassified Campylobacter]|uniref:cytochrome C n=1 Tax=unclassified Campylobacter TaxID=2593542 RepID=UPI0021E67C45|nr:MULTISPECIES: cytochrome C [unclassified Campylobacter]MCV3376672.1 cytochrome C [Campylobacter sp. IFREMER_LSEM_CL2194]MCV3396451.1 cytochrome C [Campylobacter sp. RKI_CA19_01116]MCV3482551.1 cytochrome C [Campylobacter sp. CNRCH_2014_0184h]
MKKILLIVLLLFFIACSSQEDTNVKKEVQTEQVQIEQSDSNVIIDDDTLPIPVDDDIKDENNTQGQ